MIDISATTTLTFDCYGTLIDWETGIAAALGPILERHGASITEERLLEQYVDLEAAEESGDYVSYRSILANVLRRFGRELGFDPGNAELDAFASSVIEWPAFEDSAAALKQLKEQFELVIISNTDDDLFAASNLKLEVAFDRVITAQQTKAYKPSEKMFLSALEVIGRPKDEILHVAHSIYHDIIPAKQFGLKTVWVTRGDDSSGSGATPPDEAQPDLEVRDMRELASILTNIK
ncbi:MAG: haloacid dehalogenase type II [Candidatus Zixiibacteriota bacterium]|nr:MAG: haloacid dehalogenase type II [candidate division Zixibacteria bacterium]